MPSPELCFPASRRFSSDAAHGNDGAHSTPRGHEMKAKTGTTCNGSVTQGGASPRRVCPVGRRDWRKGAKTGRLPWHMPARRARKARCHVFLVAPSCDSGWRQYRSSGYVPCYMTAWAPDFVQSSDTFSSLAAPQTRLPHLANSESWPLRTYSFRLTLSVTREIGEAAVSGPITSCTWGRNRLWGMESRNSRRRRCHPTRRTCRSGTGCPTRLADAHSTCFHRR